MEHPGAVAALAEEFAWAGADITQTFTYYSRDVGTPEGCELPVGDRRRWRGCGVVLQKVPSEGS